MMTKEQVIEKVKKLLSLSTSDNKAESELALRRAQDLIFKYSIDLEAISDRPEQLVRKDFIPSEKYPAGLKSKLAQFIVPIAAHFGCWTLTRNGVDATITGFETNVEVADYTCHLLLNQLISDYYAGMKISTNKMEFIYGFWNGALIGLTKRFEKKHEQGLIVFDRVKQMLGNLKPFNMGVLGRGEGYGAGVKSAQDASMRAGIKTSYQGKELL